jgi:phosphate transport system permease protein
MTAAFDPTAPLTPSGNLRRRKMVSRLASAGATGAALLALAVLGIVIYTVLSRGAPALNWEFLTGDLATFGGSGGIAPALVGTAVICALATAMAAPVAVLIAIFITEFADARLSRGIRLVLDLMNGLPAIVIGLFIFGLLVFNNQQSGFAASCALAVLELPLIARATQEVLMLVPSNLREAADALGVARWRTVVGVILPSASGGILTATILAVARAAGETAPLILVCSIYGNTVEVNPFGHTLANIPTLIYRLSEQPDPTGLQQAWGAAFLLLSFILITGLGARTALARSRRKIESL